MTASQGQSNPPDQPVIRSWWGRLLIGRNPWRTFYRAIVIVVLLVVTAKWILVPVRITGRSMEPTYRNGHIRFINRLAYQNREPTRGDIVSIRLQGRKMTLLKRVVGLPGERVLIRDGRVYIDGQVLEEPYARGSRVPSMIDETALGDAEYFIIGDNRDISEYGVVTRLDIRGRILF